MPDFDPSNPPAYTSMQQQMGLLPPMMQPPQVVYPGQVSAALASGGVGAAFMTQGSPGTSFGAGAFPTQMLQTYTNQNPMLQGPTGVMMPMTPGAAFNTYPGANPYAGLGARGPYSGPPGLFTPMAPAPPPAYSGQMAQFPFGPPPAAPQFNTPYMAGLERQQLTDDAMYGRGWGAAGVGARLGTNAMAGFAGASLGRRFGGTAGAIIGGFGGFLGSEFSGLGQAGQNGFMNQIASPFIQQRAATAGIEEISRSFVNSGAGLHASGQGFSHHAAAEAAAGLRSMAGSSQFRRETGDRFNQQDLFRITQESARNDMMTGAQSPSQMTGRVREIAKSLSSFMELAQEPDIQRAIQSMGQLRASGLNLSETLSAVSSGRAFARMAGTSFSEIASQAGAMGSQTFQSMGLTQGLGTQTGMMNYALARGGQNAGLFTPQMMNLMGGAQGMANQNNMFSASMLQMPMLAPSVMSSAGGINQAALQNLMGGGTNAFSQTGNAAAALQSITGRQGIGGLGAAIAMQPLIQDTIGRTLQAQGPFAQRNFEDRNIMSTMRQMGLSGSAGYMTMAQTMGMSPTQAVARAQEMASPGYWERQRQQVETTRMDERASEFSRREAMRPGFTESLGRSLGIDPSASMRSLSRRAEAFLGGDIHSHYSPETDIARRDDRRRLRSTEFSDFVRSVGDESRTAERHGRGFMGGLNDSYQIAQARGFTGIGAGIGAINEMFRGEGARDRTMADLRFGARLTGLTTSASNREMDAATRSMSQTFGADTARRIQAQMASDIASRADESGNRALGSTGRGVLNGAFRLAGMAGGLVFGGPAGAVMGATDMGNVMQSRALTGGDYQQAFVNAAMRNGVSREDATNYFRQNPSAAVQSISGRLQAQMTPEQQAAMFQSANQAAGLGSGRGGFTHALEHRENESRQRMFGNQSASFQDEFQRQLGNIRGTGREGTAANQASRRYIMAAAMLNQRLRANPSGDERRRIERQLEQLESEAGRQGVRTSDSEVQNQVIGAANRLGEGTAKDMATAFASRQAGQSGGGLLQQIQDFEGTAGNTRMARRMAGGFAQLASGSGPLADALRRAGAGDVSTFDPARVRQALQGLGREDLANVPEAQRRLINQINRGGTAGDNAFANLGMDADERAKNLRAEYQRTRGGLFTRIVDRATGQGGEDEYVNRNMNRSTEADRRADEQQEQISGAQALAERVGIGGRNDAMNQAASELRQAAQALQSVVQGGALDRAVAGE